MISAAGALANPPAANAATHAVPASKATVNIEPKGDCYIYRYLQTDERADPANSDNWQGPRSVNVSQCAALAGVQLAEARDDSAVALARWDDLELHANADGTYDVIVNGETQAHRFWDTVARVEAATDDINTFWQQVFEDHNWRYRSPSRVQSYSTRIRTACGRAPDGNAFFCRASNSIYYDIDLLNDARDDIGDFAPATIIAHEWGHAIQSQRGWFRGNTTLALEQQADCFAGAYTQYASTQGLLDDGDEQEALDLFESITDRSRASVRTHGTTRQRLAAFNTGLESGVDACLELLQD